MSEFDNIKEGDEVYVPGQYNVGGRIEPVSRVTPTTFTAGHATFHKKDGYQKGGSSWSRVHARIPTPEMRAKVMRAMMSERIRTADRSKLTYAQLEAICAILDQPQDPKPE